MSEEKKGNGMGLVHVDPDQFLEKLNGKFELLKKVRDLAIKHTRPQDWVDHGGKPRIQESGAVEVAKAFDVEISGQKITQETIRHEGEVDEIVFTITGNISIPQLGKYTGMGACSTRDNLLGTKGGKPKPLGDINLPSIQKKAHTNFVGNIISHALGLTNRTWEELESLGIKRDSVRNVNYAGHANPAQKKELSPDAQKKLDEYREMSAYCFEKDARAAKDFNVQITEFEVTDEDTGKKRLVKGRQDPAKFTENQLLKVAYPRMKEKFTAMKEVELKSAANGWIGAMPEFIEGAF